MNVSKKTTTSAVKGGATKSVNPLAALAQKSAMVQTASTTSKSSTHSVANPPQAVKEAVDKLCLAKAAVAQAKLDIDTFEPIIIDFVKPIQVKEGLAGNYQKSYRVAGIRHVGTYITANKFSVPSPTRDDQKAQYEALKDLCGDQYEELFEESTDVSFRSELFGSYDDLNDDDKALVDKVKKIIPPDLFGKLFERRVSVSAKEDLDSKRYQIFDAKELATLQEICPQAKASVRVK